MAVINTNYKALFGQAALKGTERSLQTAMQQLSTGKRINSAKDDAAGMAISTRMTQQIRALDQSVRNAGDAISLIQTVEGATNAITDMMQRMRELAIQAINDTNANEQRSYLDLEFQQLKKEIVRISDMTEWNGFQVLNGSAGARVGDRPVYKTTSVGEYDTVFIDPTTSRTITGADAGEIQTLTFTGTATGDGVITVGGVEVTILQNDTAPTIGTKVLAALKSSTEFGSQSGHTVVAGQTNDIIVINFDPARGDVAPVIVNDGGVIPAVTAAITEEAITDTEELFNGDFLHSGALNFTVSAGGAVTASFLKNDGDTITMTGTYDAATKQLTFTKAANDTVITDDLVYQFKNATSALTDITGREVKLAVDVSGSIPALQSGDLVINGVAIGASYPSDDLFSPTNNASGSAIAIAAAINRKSKMTGVTAVVNENIMTGAPMSGASVVKGNLVINGEATPTITTVLNNSRESRAAVVAAINFITHKTGIAAVDSENDAEGVRLVAVDGRNIELTFENLNASATDFSARTGLRQGVQAGTYALEAKVEQGVRIGTSPNKDLSRARLSAGNFADNVSTQVSSLRNVVSDADDIKTLKDGDLVINGFSVPASRAIDDKQSSTTPLTSSAAASAIAIAAAINKISGHTSVTATAYAAVMAGNTAELETTVGTKSLFINGREFEIDMSTATTAGERIDQIVNLVNLDFGLTGVKAEKTIEGGLKLSTPDGRNLSVAYETGADPRDFGLGVDGETAAEGFTAIANLAGFTAAETIYGKITLTSSKEFTIEPGVNGYKEESNFTALGFLEGSFGGVVRDADGKMSPPRTGRLAFQVGASAGQLITIDLADFGKRGPITSSITGDVDDPLTITESANLTKTNVTSGLQSLYINSVEVKVLFGNDTPEQRRIKVAAAINDMRTEHGVQASDNGYGLTLTTIDGRNLSVWFDSNKVGNAEEFGLGGANGVTGEPGATATFGNAKVIYPASNHIRSGEAATEVLQKLDLAMDKVNANRANMGAVMNRLQYAMDNLRNVSMNSSASRSQIEDADYAAASTELAKSQIMQQAATAVLAQANMSQQTVLKLLG
jgi:flagellin